MPAARLQIDLLKDILRASEWSVQKRGDAEALPLKPVYGGGEIIFRQGDPGAEMIVLEEGMVEVTISPRAESGGEPPAGNLILEIADRKDSIYGELSILCDIPRTATLTAIGPTKIRVIPKENLQKQLQTQPGLGVALAVTLANKLRSSHYKIGHHLINEFRISRRNRLDFCRRFAKLASEVFKVFEHRRNERIERISQAMTQSILMKELGTLKTESPDIDENPLEAPFGEGRREKDMAASLPRDAYLMRAGPTHDRDFYVIQEGVAGVYFRGTLIAQIKAGSVVGEVAALADRGDVVRTADVKALTNLSVVRIPHARAKSYLKENPEFTFQLCTQLARRIMTANTMLLNVQIKINQNVRHLLTYRREFVKIEQMIRALKVADAIPSVHQHIRDAVGDLTHLRDDFIKNQNALCKEMVAEYAADLLMKLSWTNHAYLKSQLKQMDTVCSKMGFASTEEFIRRRLEHLRAREEELRTLPNLPRAALDAVGHEIQRLNSGLRFFASAARE